MLFRSISDSWAFRLRRTNIYYDLHGAGGGVSEKSKLLHSIADDVPWANIELPTEADSYNPYAADPEDFGPGRAG